MTIIYVNIKINEDNHVECHCECPFLGRFNVGEPPQCRIFGELGEFTLKGIKHTMRDESCLNNPKKRDVS